MTKYEASLKIRTVSSSSSSSSKTENSKDLSNGDNLLKSDLRKSFDSAKDSIYDTIGSLSKNNANTPTTTTTTRGYKALAKPSINKDESIISLSIYLEDAKSSNPLKRFKANRAIASEERKRKRMAEAEKRKKNISNMKRFLFTIVDSFQNLYNSILSLPDEIDKTLTNTQMTLESSKTNLDGTMKELSRTPQKFQSAVESTKRSVAESKVAVTNVVQQVQSIPTKVENTYTNTIKNVEETGMNVAEFVKSVQDVTYNVKMKAGLLEEPRVLPTPPSTPPRSAKELALDVAEGAAKGAAVLTSKASVIVAKGTVGMTVSGAKIAWSAASSALPFNKASSTSTSRDNVKQVTMNNKKVNTVKMEELVGIPLDTIKTPLVDSIAKIDPLLELEVTEALRLAEEAMNNPKTSFETKTKIKKNTFFSSSSTIDEDGVMSIDISEALRKVKKAAAQASADAAELEDMLQNRKAMR